MRFDVKFAIMTKARDTRPIGWIKAAQREFAEFPQDARSRFAGALTIIAEGRKPDIAKPLTGLGSGVMELALKYRGDAFRVVYALQIGEAIWVIHAFQKKATKGIATPKHEIDVVRERLKRLREALK
ncbi:type II toxin-antitoxin system RelE/ParE family toxin [Phenylobacterium sp.]|uniref:type II toxin-antitoxin system RelE/ParE family toxin n=1 Tax=Phenylobacterium sp. TaxID=1871053 RepID=UPI0025E84A9B|nr:type II toxin-antitoxin system RelE/ParE family toxin [Phenylobacterium sp.]